MVPTPFAAALVPVAASDPVTLTCITDWTMSGARRRLDPAWARVNPRPGATPAGNRQPALQSGHASRTLRRTSRAGDRGRVRHRTGHGPPAGLRGSRRGGRRRQRRTVGRPARGGRWDCRGRSPPLVGDVSSEGASSDGGRGRRAAGHARRGGQRGRGAVVLPHPRAALDGMEPARRINLTGTFLVCRSGLRHLLSSQREHREPGLHRRPQGPAVGLGLRRHQGRRAGLHPSSGRRVRRAGLRVNSISPGAIDTPITAAFHLPEGADIKLSTG